MAIQLIFELPPSDPSWSSAASCINAGGAVGGGVYPQLLAPEQAGAIWQTGVEILGPSLITTAPTSQIIDLNDHGDAVGVWGEDNTPTTHAFLIRGGVLIDLAPALPAGSQANGINIHGLVVGACDLGNEGQGFVYNSVTQAAPTLIPQLPSQDTPPISYATKLNIYGNTVGVSGQNGFMLTDMLLDLGPAPFVNDINDADVIVGSVIDPATGNWRAVYWQASVDRFGFWSIAAPVQIPLPAGCNASQANAINNHGDVVGACWYPGGDNIGNAFIGNISHPASFDLNKVFSDAAIQGWELQVANDVNDIGSVVGTGLLNGQTRGFFSFTETLHLPFHPIPRPGGIDRI